MASANTATAQETPIKQGKKKERSPSYPGINLETAIARAKDLLDKEGQVPASVSVVASDWGMTEKSSSTLVAISALKAFGLISDTGMGANRRLQVTDLARRIILDKRQDSQERSAAIKTAALNPKMHRTLWSKWGNNLPSEANMHHSLIFDHKFNANIIGDFIRLYKDTIRFAKLSESDKVTSEDGNNEEGGSGQYVPQVGDYVQWESQGTMRFKEPVKVLSISTDQTHAFVEGTSTGLPVHQLIRASAPEKSPQLQTLHAPLLPQSNMQEDVYSLPEGRIVVQWPTALSAESIQEVKDYLKLLERKIMRSTAKEKIE
jgi:hypothetical protein